MKISQMMKPNITTYYLVHDLRDDASWGAYETIIIQQKIGSLKGE